MLQVRVIKLMLGCMVASLGVSGLTSHAYSTQQRRFANSYFMVAYSLAVIISFTLIYGKEVLNDFLTNQFDLKNAIKLYSNLSFTASIINYITALVLSRALVRLLNNVSLFDTIVYFDVSTSLAFSSVLLVAVKAILFPLVVELTLLLQQIRNDPERNLLWTLYTLLPMVLASMLPNCFFGAMVISKMLIGVLNLRLQEITNEVNCMQTGLQMQLQKPYYRMQRFCDLADKMDVLAQKYAIICKQTTEYVQLMAVPFICSLLCNLFGITSGFFTQYLAIADTLINEEPYDVFNALTNSIFLIVSLSEILLEAYICNENITTVQETGIILQRITLLHADVRFKQSVEAFSLHIFMTKYKIQPLGLLEINVSLIHNVLSAVTSFLLIIIQSDLTLRFSLK